LRRKHKSNIAFAVTTRQTRDNNVAFFALVVVCLVLDLVLDTAIVLHLRPCGILTNSGDTEFALRDISACVGEQSRSNQLIGVQVVENGVILG
jgi:hypothetical protein